MLIPFDSLTKKYRFQPQGVLHIGANVGEERHAYQNLRVNKVIWIEANERIFKRLQQNLASFPNQQALNYLIGDIDNKDVAFNISNNGSQSSSIFELGTHKIVHPEVKYIGKVSMKMKRVDKIDYDFSGLDFLNIDLQGAELLALKGMGSLLDQFNFAYLEFNRKELYKGCALMPELIRFMKRKGFSFKEAKDSGSHGWGDLFMMRVKDKYL